MSHGDSAFAFKHLGVMYAASATTREKGRYFMAQLINIEPTAKILDMYASDLIDLIFRNVQEASEAKRSPSPKPIAPIVEPVTVTTPVSSTSVAVTEKPKSKSRTAYWVTGGAVAIAGTIGILFILFDEPKPKKQTIVLPL